MENFFQVEVVMFHLGVVEILNKRRVFYLLSTSHYDRNSIKLI